MIYDIQDKSVKKRWWHWITGCRPMTYLGYAFLDVISCEVVHYFKTSDGKVYLAESEWSWFRVEVTDRTGH